jgi:peptidoglycan hydrolase-like protein with peptidoglycan-binding domain
VSPFQPRLLLAALLLVPPVFAATVHKTPAKRHSTSASQKTTVKQKASSASKSSSKSRTAARSKKTRAKKLRGQQSIDSERVTQIQQALIREHYLSGAPSGSWDAQSQSAMQKYQADHGWQTRLMPDARAIKTLGLGPDYSTAINAAGASFSPPSGSTASPAQNEGFTQAAGIKE